MEEYQKFQGLNLYFKNIDESAYSEEMLKKAFLDFGEITSFVLMRNDDEKKTTKGFGFVSFKKSEDAQNALNKLHGKMLTEKSKPLYVNTAQRKDVRRQQLEIQHSQRGFNQLQNVYPNVFNIHSGPNQQQVQQNQFYNNIMRPRWTNQNNNQNNNNQNNNNNNQNNLNQRKKI